MIAAVLACAPAPVVHDDLRYVGTPYPTVPQDWLADADGWCAVDPWPDRTVYGLWEDAQLGLVMAAADFDRDGFADLAAYLHYGGFAVYYGTPGGFPPYWSLQIGMSLEPDPVLAASGDLDADGRPEVIAGSALGVVGVYMAVRPYEPLIETPGGRWAAAFDADADWYGDLLVAGLAPDTVRLFRGLASGALPTPTAELSGDPGFGAAGIASAGDIDGDGLRDVVVFDGAGDLTILRGGSGFDGAYEVPGTGADLAGPPVTADLDGDGYGDLITARRGGGDGGIVAWWRGGPDGLSATPSVELGGVAGDRRWVPIGLGDLDGDGDDELAIGAWGAADESGEITVHPGGPDGPAETPTFRIHASGAGCQLGRSLAAGDFDGDGAMDLAAMVASGPTEEGEVGAIAILRGEAAWVR